ncbi:MAG: 50S ribosomal protein L17 [Desulfonatronovibrio sp.]
MRHRKSGKKLGRTWEHRKAMFRNMAKSLIVYEKIRTTVPKAKEVSKIMDKLVTLAIRNDLNARRQAYKILENHKLVQKLFNDIGPKFSAGQGGYTRVVKFAAPRVGDSAAMAVIEFAYGKEQKNLQASESTKPAAQAPLEKTEAVTEPAEAPDTETDEVSASQEFSSSEAESEQPESEQDESEQDETEQAENMEVKTAAPEDVLSEIPDSGQADSGQAEIPEKENK